MNKISFITISIILTSLSVCAQKKSKYLTNLADSMSYSIGTTMAKQIKGQFDELNIVALSKGINNGMNDSEVLLITNDEAGEVMKRFQNAKLNETNTKEEVSSKKKKKFSLTNLSDSISYVIGTSMAEKMKVGFKEVNVDALAKGLTDGMDSTSIILISETENKEVMQRFQTIKMTELKTEQQAYLEKNKNVEGVIVTKSGLQYRILEKGNGNYATLGETVEVNYEGKLIDGTIFDSSFERGQTFKFNTNGGVIPAWIEISKLVPMGSVVEIVAPYTLAYGENGNRGIPPYATLIFKIQMIDIVKE